MGILADMDSGTLDADVPSFVDGNTGDFFAITRTGDDTRDFAIGEALANQALAYSQSKGDGELIALSLYAIITRGRCEHLEAGYIRRLAAAAYAGRLN